jgi:hypothetical protein
MPVAAPVQAVRSSGRRSPFAQGVGLKASSRRRARSRAEASPATAIEPLPLPDEEAYALCLEAIRARRDKLERMRGDVAKLRQDLNRFEALCHARVGDLVAELRRVGAAVAEAQAQLEGLLSRAERLTEEVVEAVLAGLDLEHDLDLDRAGRKAEPLLGEQTAAPERREPSDPATLKRLYRELAKRCHPDLAANAEERERRAILMQRVNEAFAEGNADLLRVLLHQTEADAPGFAERSAAERLRWARGELAALDCEIAALRRELVTTHASDLYRLWRRHQAGEAIFDELEDDLERRIRREGGRIDRLHATHRRLVAEGAAAPVTTT